MSYLKPERMQCFTSTRHTAVHASPLQRQVAENPARKVALEPAQQERGVMKEVAWKTVSRYAPVMTAMFKRMHYAKTHRDDPVV